MTVAPPPSHFSKQMGFRRSDFLDQIPLSIGDFQLIENGDELLISDQHNRLLTLTLHPEGERRIALLRIPTLQVDFSFSGFSPTERAAFMHNFDLHMRRGGG